MSQRTNIVEPEQFVASPQQVGEEASRRSFLTLTAAACGAALLVGSTPARALGYGDQKLLRYLEEVERIQQEFFTRASLSGTADGLSEREINTLNLITQQDAEHVSWFVLAAQKYGVGASNRSGSINQESSRPARNYRFNASSLGSRSSLYSTALTLKEAAVGAYHGIVIRAQEPEIVQAVASLAGVEGRHLALLRDQTGQDPFTTYEAALSPTQVARRLEAFGFSREVI